jgi:hypothetical protein
LKFIDSHYAFSIISNCISAPKLLYTLRTSCCVGNDLLARFDSSVKVGLETVLNVRLSDSQWLQASLPVHEGGLGVRSVVSLASSAFLASAAGTRELQDRIIPDIAWRSDSDFDECLSVWCVLTSAEPVQAPGMAKQRSWDCLVVEAMKRHLRLTCPSDLDSSRILAASAPHSGDWLFAIPSANCGLFLENEELRIAVGLRIGASVCLPHDCVCGGQVDALGLHCFTCRKGNGKQVRHSLLNDAIWRSFNRAKIQAQKEPAGLCFAFKGKDGHTANKRPDGASIVPWGRGRNIAWDVTVADTFAASYLPLTSVCAGAAAERAAMLKIVKYEELARNHIFAPLACEVTGVWCEEAVEILQELGSRISAATGDKRETSFLFQRLSIALQKGNAACMLGSFPFPADPVSD